jgi:hypothetical protein
VFSKGSVHDSRRKQLRGAGLFGDSLTCRWLPHGLETWLNQTRTVKDQIYRPVTMALAACHKRCHKAAVTAAVASCWCLPQRTLQLPLHSLSQTCLHQICQCHCPLTPLWQEAETMTEASTCMAMLQRACCSQADRDSSPTTVEAATSKEIRTLEHDSDKT